MSILAKAKSLAKREDILIFGETARGKSSLATLLGQRHKKVAYIAYGSPYPKLPDTWDAARVFDLKDLNSVMSEVPKGGYDCVIFDDYNMSMALHVPQDATPSLQQYGHLAVKWSVPLFKIVKSCKSFIMTINAVQDTDDSGKSNGLKLDITPRAFKNVVGLFNYRYLVWKGLDPTTKQPSYMVETDAIEALKFNPTKSSVLTSTLISDTIK